MIVLVPENPRLTLSRWRPFSQWFPELLFVLGLMIAATSLADDATSVPPFVSGFDRFARHAEIDAVLAGRLLIAELSCAACHTTDDVLLNPKRGPVLDGAGSRIKADWMRSFLLSPAITKPGTTMPDVFAGLPPKERESAADAISAFLSSLRQPFPEISASGLNPVPMEFWKRGNVENGRRLYHQIGCVACHEPDRNYEVTGVKPSPLDQLLEQLDPDELKEMGLSSAARRDQSVPHPELTAKYTHQSLAWFLLNPEHVRPAGRMPNFSLQSVEAADIAAWLLHNIDPSPLQNIQSPELNERLITQGRQYFADLRCANCHQVQGLTANRFAKPLAAMNSKSLQTCVVANFDALPEEATRENSQPRWRLDLAQQSAIHTALNGLARQPAHVPASEPGIREVENLTFHLLQQNCYACHERTQLGGVGRFRKPYFETVGHVDIGDEGRFPPALTGVGQHLTTALINSVLTGKGAVRPFMTIRMPVFPADATKLLPALFTNVDLGSTKPRTGTQVFAHADHQTLVDAGRQLMDTGCVQCHPFKGEALPGTVGVDLQGAVSRIHPEWLHDFLKDPGSLKNRTRMPTFFPNGRSQNTEVLNGDAELQIAAMHAYLSDLDTQPLPAKLQQARDQNYELTPVDRPIVLRTFMPVTGMHAIAVGFPQHVHFGFDAEHINLAQAWRGRFLDAEGTWFVRFAPPANPLGEKLISFPSGIAIALLKDKLTTWPADTEAANAAFRGYRLDKNGVPTFLYRIGEFSVYDRIEPAEAGGLRRSITVDSKIHDGSAWWFRALTGNKLQQTSPQSFVNDTGLSVTVTANGLPGETRTAGEMTEWIIPLDFGVEPNAHASIEVRYQW